MMSSTNYDHAVHRAYVWLADVSTALGTEDRAYARRVLRAWLHTLRDRLTVEGAAKFAQQLPELLRGTFYDGWEPSRVPVKFNSAEYTYRFSTEAMVPASEVPGLAAAVTRVISGHMSPGQVDEALAELPIQLRETIRDGAPVPATGERARPTGPAPSLEERLASLTEAVRALARGLEGERAVGQRAGDTEQVARAARLAEELLVASGR